MGDPEHPEKEQIDMDKRIFLSPPHLAGNEIQYVNDALASNYVAPCGPMVDLFETKFSACVRMPFVCAVSSATSALELLCDVLSIGRGDTVFCSDLTFIASIGPAVRRGATPVFIDCDEKTWTMDPVLLERALEEAKNAGNLPKAVVAVDLYGQCCDYAVIEPLCKRFGVPLIADAAEALGATFQAQDGSERCAGDAGFAGFWSFNGNKIITTSGGGMVASHDKAVVDKIRFLSQQAREPVSWYEHREIGVNARMSNISAAIGVGQIECLPDKVRRRREIREIYREGFSTVPGLRFLEDAPYCKANCWLTVIRLPGGADPEQVRLELEKSNVESRHVWKPMHLQPVFQGAKIYGGSASERLFAEGLCLPSGTAMTDDEVGEVASLVRSALPL